MLVFRRPTCKEEHLGKSIESVLKIYHQTAGFARRNHLEIASLVALLSVAGAVWVVIPLNCLLSEGAAFAVFWFSLALVGLAFLVLLAAKHLFKKDWAFPKLVPLYLIGILLYGLSLRLAELVGTWRFSLEPDAETYQQLALNYAWFDFYNPSFQASFFIQTLKTWFRLFGDSEVSVRLMAVFFSLLLVLGVFWVGKTLLDDLCGLIKAFSVASSKYLVFNSVRGLREELAALFFSLSFVCFLFRKKKRSSGC